MGHVAGQPDIVAIVDLEEGVRMNSQMRGVMPDEMRIGLPVQVTFERTKEGLTMPMGRPRASRHPPCSASVI